MGLSSTNVIGTADNFGDSPPLMATLGKDIKTAREAKGWSQAVLARKVGISQPAIRKIESGETIKSKWLPEIMTILEIKQDNGQSLPLRENYKPPPEFMDYRDLIPVYSSAEGGEGHIIVSHDEIGRAPRPNVLDDVKGAYAILVTGNSMIPAYKPGDRAWVNPLLSEYGGTDCVLYAIDEAGESRATIKEMVTWTDKEWTVCQHNPPKTFKLDRSVWKIHHRVVGNFRRR